MASGEIKVGRGCKVLYCLGWPLLLLLLMLLLLLLLLLQNHLLKGCGLHPITSTVVQATLKQYIERYCTIDEHH